MICSEIPDVGHLLGCEFCGRHASPEGPLSDEERESIMPLEMWGVTGDEWPFGLSHALACVLLAESLISKQVMVGPLFSRRGGEGGLGPGSVSNLYHCKP